MKPIRHATILNTDGSHRTIYPGSGGKFALATLQEAVGGYIEPVVHRNEKLVDEKMILFCNEEGAILGLPFNECASMLARIEIRGNAIVVPAESFD